MKTNYKNYIIPLLLWCVAFPLLRAQTQSEPLIQKNWILNTPESTTKNYIAGESIKLQASGSTGFSFKATNDGKTFSAKIDPVLLFPPTTQTYKKPDGSFTTDPTQGAVVGSIPGQFAVSPTGAATYTIPIEVPAGINGMQPNISVGYSSQAGYGTLGTGWNINGVSAITRGGKDLYFDSNTKGIKFDNTDALYLDGQRLIQLNSESVGNLCAGAIYGTEVEDYARVEILINSDNKIYFQITTQDGKILEFGKTNDSRIECTYRDNSGTKFYTLSWKLNKTIDTYGNNIDYTYINSSAKRGEGHNKQISRIDYGGRSIEFSYIPNKTYDHTYNVFDVKIVQPGLLESITTKVGSTTTKRYEFVYNDQDKITEVKLSDGNNIAIKSSIINWGNTTGQPEFKSLGNVANSSLSSYPKGTSSVDFVDINGDGYNDRVERWIGQKVGNNTTNGFINVYFYNNTTKSYSTTISTSQVITYADYEKFKQQFLFVDINNDGKEEIIYTSNNNLHVFTYMNGQLLPFFADGSGVYDTRTLIGDYDKNKMVKITARDVDHDSFADIVIGYYNKISTGHRGYAVFFGSPNGLTIRPPKAYRTYEHYDTDTNYSLDYFDFGDFNADSKLDMFCIASKDNLVQPRINDEILTDNEYITLSTSNNLNSNSFYAQKPSTFKVIDINNDGLSDWLYCSSTDGKWRLNKPNGLGLYDSNTTILPFSGDYCQFVDLNGDGLIDVLSPSVIYDYENYNNGYPDNIGTEWSFYKNLGNGEYTSTPLTVKTPNPYSTFNKYTNADINGDGITDFIEFHGTNIYVITIPHANYQNLVSSVTNGMGLTESVSYKNFSEYEPYNANELNAKVRPLRAPLLVADTHTHIDGSKTVYSFEAPKYHTEGKGFLGFAVLKTSNTDNNVKTTSNYEFIHYDTNDTQLLHPYYFSALYWQSISTISGSNDISYSSQTNKVKVINSALKRYIPYVSDQDNTDALKNLTQTTTTNYNNYPNSLTQSTETGDLTITTRTTFTGPENKIPFLPDTVLTTRTQGGKSFTKETNYSFTYDGTNPYKIIGKTETVDPGDANSIATTYSNFDPWGHPQNINITANGKTRGSAVKYYTSSTTEANAGQYLRSRTNVLGESTIYNWNVSTGLLDSETDARGNTTTYKYTAFGQLKETIYPNGLRKASTLQWAGSGDVSGAKYSSYTESSGSAPVFVWYDVLGRPIQSDTYGLNGKKISVSTEYYAENDFAAKKRKGMVYRVSEPYFEADAANKVWAKTLTYDEYGRTVKAIIPMGELSNEYNRQARTTTVKTPESTTITTLNSAGQVLTSSVNGKTVTYEYYPSGLVKTSTPQDGEPIKMVYDKQGKQTHLFDPNSGLTRSEYNGFGELTLTKQRVHATGDSIETTYTYKTDGRLESIDRNDEITTYSYSTTQNYQNRISTIEIKNKNNQVQNRQTFTYDPVSYTDRVSELKEEIADNSGALKVFIKKTEYDLFGRVKKEVFPTGYYTLNKYDRYSNLIETKDGSGRQLWKTIAQNARGQLTEALKGGRTINYGFDTRGLPNSIQAAGIVNMWYTFKVDGNLWSKEDYISEQAESYNYDELNRLTNWDIYIKDDLIKQNSIVYNPTSGTIQSKTDIGNFEMSYGENGKPHILTTISGVPSNFPQPNVSFPLANLDVTYTDFKKIKKVEEMGKTYELTYGVDDQRRKSVQTINGYTKTHYYVGDYEEESDNAGNIKKIHYLSGAIYVSSYTQGQLTEAFYYTYADYQGSLIALTDESGNVVERYAYDPWGARRNPDNWTEKDNRTTWIVNRGYTGHEHLDAFGIINMNGRVYDPLTAQFFSPDPVMTDAGNWLDYNKYGYCLNNPFRYTDPSGYTWWAENGNMVITTAASIVVGGVVAIATAGTGVPAMIASGMAAGAAGGFTGGAVGTVLAGGSFGDAMMAGMQGAIVGGIMGGITAGIGASFGGVGSIAKGTFNVWNELGRAGVHALAQGGFSVMRGGDFWQGAAAGFVSSLAGSAAQGVGIHGWGMVGVSAFSGGVGAAIAGGKAEDILFGIVQGAMVGALNHFGTELQERRYVQKIINKMIETKCGYKGAVSFKDILNGLSNLNEQNAQFSAVVNIGGEKVRVGIVMLVNEKYLNDNLEFTTSIQYQGSNKIFDGENESFVRNGLWEKLLFNRYNSNSFSGYYPAPFEIHYSSKYNNLIHNNLIKL